MKIFYLYVSPRTQLEKEFRVGDGPDTLLYGKNHFEKKHQVKFSDNGLEKNFWWLVCLPIEKILIWATGYGFKLAQVLTNFRELRDSEVVIACAGSAGLPLGLLRIFGFLRKQTIVLINIGLVESWGQYPRLVRFFYQKLYGQFDQVICFSKVERQILLEKISLSDKKVFFVPLGTDVRFFKPAKDNPKEVILSVGRDKGRDYKLLFATARLMSEKKFVIITSPRNLRNLSIPENVTVLFDVDYKTLRKHYVEAEMVVLPLKPVDRASGQLVLLEALAMNRPVIATNSPGLLSGYEALRSSVILTASDPRNLAKAIHELSNEAKGLNSKDSAAIIRQQFSTEIMSDEIEKAISQTNS